MSVALYLTRQLGRLTPLPDLDWASSPPLTMKKLLEFRWDVFFARVKGLVAIKFLLPLIHLGRDTKRLAFRASRGTGSEGRGRIRDGEHAVK